MIKKVNRFISLTNLTLKIKISFNTLKSSQHQLPYIQGSFYFLSIDDDKVINTSVHCSK